MVKIKYKNQTITIPIYEQNAQEINQASYFNSKTLNTKVVPLTTFMFTNKVLTEYDIILWGNALEKTISDLIVNIVDDNDNVIYKDIKENSAFVITNYKITTLPIIDNKDEDVDIEEKIQIIVSGQLCHIRTEYIQNYRITI